MKWIEYDASEKDIRLCCVKEMYKYKETKTKKREYDDKLSELYSTLNYHYVAQKRH